MNNRIKTWKIQEKAKDMVEEDFSVMAKKGVNASLTDSQYDKLKVIRDGNPDLTSWASVIKYLIDNFKTTQKSEMDIDRTDMDKWLVDLNNNVKA